MPALAQAADTTLPTAVGGISGRIRNAVTGVYLNDVQVAVMRIRDWF